MTDHDYYPKGNSLDDYFPREIVQFKQHTFSCAFMVRIFRVLTYMNLYAREIRLFVYQTIKWHLLKLLLLIFFLNITINNFYLCLFNSHIFSEFLDCLWHNKKLIYWIFAQQQVHCPPRHQESTKTRIIFPRTISECNRLSQLVSRRTIHLLLSSQPVNRCIIFTFDRTYQV